MVFCFYYTLSTTVRLIFYDPLPKTEQQQSHFIHTYIHCCYVLLHSCFCGFCLPNRPINHPANQQINHACSCQNSFSSPEREIIVFLQLHYYIYMHMRTHTNTHIYIYVYILYKYIRTQIYGFVYLRIVNSIQSNCLRN